MSLDQSLLPNICHFLSTTDPFDLLRESELKLLAGQIEIPELQRVRFQAREAAHHRNPRFRLPK